MLTRRAGPRPNERRAQALLKSDVATSQRLVSRAEDLRQVDRVTIKHQHEALTGDRVVDHEVFYCALQFKGFGDLIDREVLNVPLPEQFFDPVVC